MKKIVKLKYVLVNLDFKDSIIVNFNFTVFTVSGGNDSTEIKKTEINQQNIIIRPPLEIMNGSSYKPFECKDNEGNSYQYNASGSAYQPNYKWNDNDYEYDEN